ncbi:MAG: filamentous hemagglutinin N-terminal domain-containing protein [Phenylobacterium sp.]|nr:filamentous hemagglutinin N-terminal domain-containing protein [Phenylobacterium sp.]
MAASARILRLAAGAAGVALLAAGSAGALPVYSGNALVSAGGGAPTINTLPPNLVIVDLNAPRTIIDWTSFNLAAGETVSYAFAQNNWIALNRVGSGEINIDGFISAARSTGFPLDTGATAGGNVWFYSPDGVVFGPNARANVGGLLATSAAVDPAQFLNAANLTMRFTGSGSGGPVTIAGGGTFTARGHLAFVAPRVTSGAGATINAGDLGTAAYGGVDSYEITFIPIGANDLAFFTFQVPNAASGTPFAEALNLAGQTTGANVYLMAMSRAALTSTLINAPGLLVGASSVNAYGQVTISTGRNIVLGQVGHGAETQQVAGVTTGSVELGEIDAQGNVNIYLTGTGSIGDLTVEDGVRAGQGLLIAAKDITVGAGGVSAGDRGVNFGSVIIDTSGSLTTPSITARTDIFVTPGAVAAGRPNGPAALDVGAVTAGGELRLNGSSVRGTVLRSGTQTQIFATLPVNFTSLTTGGYTRVSSSQTITAGTIQGVDLDLRSAGGITATTLVGSTSVAVGTAGVAAIGSITGPSLTMDTSNARLGTVTIANDARIRTSNLDISGSLTAANLALESQVGTISLGGTSEPGLTDEEFQRIRVTGAFSIYAGQREPSVNVPVPVFGTMTVADLRLDPNRIPRLELYANQNHEVRIEGALGVTASGGQLFIGAPEAGSPWAPGAIIVTGTLGEASGDPLTGFTDVAAFNSVAMHATNDILVGSSRFVDLIGDTPADEIDIGAGLPLGVAATDDEVGQLFIVSGHLTMTANDRIVQQNTGAMGTEGGIYLTGAGVPPDEPLLVLGRARVGDLFGAFATADGLLAIGRAGAFSNRIVREAGDTSAGAIRINGCPLGIGCASFTPANQFRVEQFRPASVRAAIDPPVLTPPPPLDDDEREGELVTTGAGNEEIWRRDR